MKEIPGVKLYDIRRKPDIRPRWERYKDLNFNIRWIQNLHQIIRVRKIVNKINPDIVHSHSLWYPGYLGVYINGLPFVFTWIFIAMVELYSKIETKTNYEI